MVPDSAIVDFERACKQAPPKIGSLPWRDKSMSIKCYVTMVTIQTSRPFKRPT